ncbi:MAG: tyrosine recombinase XerC, partial [Gammaproteobacteria bacterium]|nr:tyrosine recombinase XerC [Gammaproteobacteria bacterium]
MDSAEKERIAQFIHHLEFERRLSSLTCKNYRRDLNALATWCDGTDAAHWRDLDSEHFRDWSAAAYRRGLSSKTIQRRLSAARTFYRYLLRERLVDKNPVQSVSAPKAPKRLPGNLDADRMARLLDIPGKGPIVSRDRAILELLYSSGLRLAELTDLNLGDVDIGDRTVRVTGKGNKDRIVPVGRKALTAMRAWLKERVALAEGDEKALFVSARGSRLSKRAVQARVKHWAKHQGIDTRVYPHLFRHS